MSELTSLPELRDLRSGRSLIRVPDEQNVPFTDRVRALVDTAEFQRLQGISQLGLVSRVYPGAKHTRFEHALGVYHNVLRYLDHLAQDERFCSIVDSDSAELLIVSALLHDLGHWPFCHPIEDLGLDGLPSHEEHASEFLANGSELSVVLERDWGLNPDNVLEILVPKTHSPRLKLLRSILSGPIDVDKMDYLDRDSLHCGVPYGRNFDRQRLIQSLMLNEAGDGLAITAKGKTAAELMVFARYVMFSEVYWHHAVRSATSMFARAFYNLHLQFDLRNLFRLSEHGMIAKLQEAAKGTDNEQLLEGIFGPRRLLFKRAAEFTHDQHPEIYQRLAGRPYEETSRMAIAIGKFVSQQTGIPLSLTDILIDAPPPYREVEFAIDVYFPKDREYRPLRRVSPVVEALATTQFDDWVKRVRVFISPRLTEPLGGLNWIDVIQKTV
ncbi:MAG: HD domain-containing protein [Planctomycetaceae bacterium]|nr:HD domain-containing protein [Planctomycetaceae bacterium]